MAEIQVVDEGRAFPRPRAKSSSRPSSPPRIAASGWALAICHRIVEEHKGAMQVTSEPGHGTAFSCFLPIAK